ncbi:hypothetical protein WNY37_09010 [Henriciella sp. AS95]
MIAALIAVRDFFVAVLISWLGVASDTVDTQKDTETVKPNAVSTAMLR